MAASTDVNSAPSGASLRVTLWVAVLAVTAVLLLAFTAADPFYLAPFRESQTAISADWLVREPSNFLGFQLPVFGAPWRVPFEFPLFQQLTAWLAQTGLGVAQAGRLLSLLAGIGCVPVALRLLRTAGLPTEWTWPGVALLATAPLYTIYATAHLIESLALLFALVHVLAFVRFLGGAGWGHFALALVTGVLAAAVKITTWLPAGFLLGLLLLGRVGQGTKQHGLAAGLPARWFWLGLLVLAPFVAGLGWSKWCAEVRSHNAMSAAVMSGPQLNEWMFGTLRQRLSPKTWTLIGAKHCFLLFGPLGVWVPVLLAQAWRAGGGLANPRVRALGWLLTGYGIHVALFTGLHLRHDYYVYGAGVYLISALVLALVTLAETGHGRLVRWFTPALAASMGLAALLYVTVKRGYHDVATEQVVLALTELKDDGALITFGLDWSPRVPFATGRKALMVPADGPAKKALPAALAANRDTKFAAVAVLGGSHDAAAALAAQAAGLDSARHVPFWPNGYLLLRSGADTSSFPPTTSHPTFAELGQRVPPRRSLPDGLVFRHRPFGKNPGDWFEAVVKRDTDAFFFRAHGLQLVRVRGYFQEP